MRRAVCRVTSSDYPLESFLIAPKLVLFARMCLIDMFDCYRQQAYEPRPSKHDQSFWLPPSPKRQYSSNTLFSFSHPKTKPRSVPPQTQPSNTRQGKNALHAPPNPESPLLFSTSPSPSSSFPFQHHPESQPNAASMSTTCPLRPNPAATPKLRSGVEHSASLPIRIRGDALESVARDLRSRETGAAAKGDVEGDFSVRKGT